MASTSSDITERIYDFILALIAAGICQALPEANEMASYKTVRL